MKNKFMNNRPVIALLAIACAATGLGLGGAPRMNSVLEKTGPGEALVYLKIKNIKVGDHVEFYDRRCPRLEPCEEVKYGKGVITTQSAPNRFVVKADENVKFEEGTRVRKVRK